MADLKTDYKDDVLDTEVNELRKYQMIQNEDGTVSFVDVTEYLQVGDSFGSADVNDITLALNETINRYNQVFRTVAKNYMVTPAAEKSVVELPYDLTDVIPTGYSPTGLLTAEVHYTNSHAYQQVTITDTVNISGTARLMVETQTQFSFRIIVLCYKNDAFREL